MPRAVRALTSVRSVLIAAMLPGCMVSASLVPCSLVTTPAVGEWTEPFGDHADETCEDGSPLARAIYDAQVDAVRAETVSLLFRKTAADPAYDAPMADIQWWLVEGRGAYHECSDIEVDPVRIEGTWEEGEPELLIEEFELWPSALTDHAPVDGDVIYLYLVTGGLGHEDEKLWWQLSSVMLERQCPEVGT